MNQTHSARPKTSSRHRLVRLQASEARSDADQAESAALAAKADFKRARKAYKQAKKTAKVAKKRLKALVRKLKKLPPSKKRPVKRSPNRPAAPATSGAAQAIPADSDSGPAPAGSPA